MKYFNGESGENFMKLILSEAFNLEAGKVYYENGKLIGSNKSPLYPSFVVDKIRTTIKTNMGFIFVPRRLIENFQRGFKAGLLDMTYEFKSKFGFDHLQTYSPLETGSDHFTVLKVKHNLDETTSHKYMYNNYKRYVYVNEGFDRLDKIVGNARFTWILYTIEQLIEDFSSINIRKIPIECQLVSILYDPDYLISLPNNYLQISNLTLRNFKVTKNSLALCTYGVINDEFVEKYNETTNQIIKDLIDQYNNHKLKPEYHPGWYPTYASLVLCEKRKGAFEIIRHHGNWNMFMSVSMGYMPIVPLIQAVYEIEYKDIVIDNSPYGKSNSLCFNCDTPLYDDIYLIFKSKATNIAAACCPVCMHGKFDMESKTFSISGTLLYHNQNIIGRTIYPRKASELINAIDTDDIVKEILIASFNSSYTDNYNMLRAMHLNFPKSNGGKKLIGWNGSLGTYIPYANDSFSDVYHKFSKKEDTKKYLESSYIFPYIYVVFK